MRLWVSERAPEAESKEADVLWAQVLLAPPSSPARRSLAEDGDDPTTTFVRSFEEKSSLPKHAPGSMLPVLLASATTNSLFVKEADATGPYYKVMTRRDVL